MTTGLTTIAALPSGSGSRSALAPEVGKVVRPKFATGGPVTITIDQSYTRVFGRIHGVVATIERRTFCTDGEISKMRRDLAGEWPLCLHAEPRTDYFRAALEGGE